MAEIPRLFQLLPGHPEPTPGAVPVADGVQWPDGTVTVQWTVPEPAIDTWPTFDDEEAQAALTEFTVVWRMANTYVDEPS